jgi:hypothetical protein
MLLPVRLLRVFHSTSVAVLAEQAEAQCQLCQFSYAIPLKARLT